MIFIFRPIFLQYDKQTKIPKITMILINYIHIVYFPFSIFLFCPYISVIRYFRRYHNKYDSKQGNASAMSMRCFITYVFHQEYHLSRNFHVLTIYKNFHQGQISTCHHFALFLLIKLRFFLNVNIIHSINDSNSFDTLRLIVKVLV